MPIYMDRHDVSDTVTAEHVAQIHALDLEIQHQFNCKGLTYWFDGVRKTAFCLFEAPNKKAIVDLHDHAHGVLPHRIIEVDDKIVESFLGRIEDPEKSKETQLNIIDEPAFRILMVIGFKGVSLKSSMVLGGQLSLLKYTKPVHKIVDRFHGRIVKQDYDALLISFESVTQAVLCALKMKSKFENVRQDNHASQVKLKMGLSAGAPVNDRGALFEETIKMAGWLFNVVDSQIAMSSEVKYLYENENRNVFYDKTYIKILDPSEENFLNKLMDYTEKMWRNTELKVDDFSKNLGLSKSQLYRKMVSLTGKSLNTFIKEYRLTRALNLLKRKSHNISQVAFETGFNSPAYFSKCFQETYGKTPSVYIRQLT